MSQYTFSFVRSEYDRIPYMLKKELSALLESSKADAETKKLVGGSVRQRPKGDR